MPSVVEENQRFVDTAAMPPKKRKDRRMKPQPAPRNHERNAEPNWLAISKRLRLRRIASST